MPVFLRLLGSLVFLAWATGAPFAQTAPSPAPVGVWQGTNSGDVIWLKPDMSCAATGSVNVHGECRWAATFTGGVLTMTYFWVIDYANLGWSIRWLDRDRILVNEVEVFVRME